MAHRDTSVSASPKFATCPACTYLEVQLALNYLYVVMVFVRFGVMVVVRAKLPGLTGFCENSGAAGKRCQRLAWVPPVRNSGGFGWKTGSDDAFVPVVIRRTGLGPFGHPGGSSRPWAAS